MVAIPKITKRFETSLASGLSESGGSFTLESTTDEDGGSLSGLYGMTIDVGSSNVEDFIVTISGSTATVIARGIDADDPVTEVEGNKKPHRRGAPVVITDYPILAYVRNILNGESGYALPNKLSYASNPTWTTQSNELVTVKKLEDTAIQGAADASTSVKGITKLSTAPAVAATPIAVGDNDPRVPTANQALALAGTGTPSATDPYINTSTLLGLIAPYAGFLAPAGWLLCNGAAVSRATYANLFGLLNPSLGTMTVTIASPGVVSLTAHGLVLDDIVYFTTTGALPTGLSVNTRYYVISAGLTADAFQVSATKGGSAINTSGSQSGVHTLRRSPYGVGDGSTTFNVPDLRGLIPVGRDSTQTEFNAIGETGGEKTHILTVPEIPAHTHTVPADAGANAAVDTVRHGVSGTAASGSTGGDGAHNNLQPYISLNYIIKT